MPKRKNLVGNVYGELQVIEMLYKYNGTNRTYCKCIGINDKEHKEYIITPFFEGFKYKEPFPYSNREILALRRVDFYGCIYGIVLQRRNTKSI